MLIIQTALKPVVHSMTQTASQHIEDNFISAEHHALHQETAFTASVLTGK
jgi:hypothetical protein